MDLRVKKRTTQGKTLNKKMRRTGQIPAILYAGGRQEHLLEFEKADFEAILRAIKPGRLSTTVFTLELEGKKIRAIVKDIQYKLTTYEVIHLDFQELQEDVPVCVKVPIECTGLAECVGVKLGGLLRQVIRKVQVKCLPKDIPFEFQLDVRELGIKQVKCLSDIKMPVGVEPLSGMDAVIVVIAKR